MRLIDANALKKALNIEFKDYLLYLPIAFKDLIDNAPTVEPQYFPPCEDCNKKMEEIRRAYDNMKAMERPNGKWINDMSVYLCGNCGMESTHKSPFCPYCGADMRESNTIGVDNI